MHLTGWQEAAAPVQALRRAVVGMNCKLHVFRSRSGLGGVSYQQSHRRRPDCIPLLRPVHRQVKQVCVHAPVSQGNDSDHGVPSGQRERAQGTTIGRRPTSVRITDMTRAGTTERFVSRSGTSSGRAAGRGRLARSLNSPREVGSRCYICR